MNIPFLDAGDVATTLPLPMLIEALKEAFGANEVVVPSRHHHDYANPIEGMDSTLLLMPAWEGSKDLGVKLVTVSPANGKYNLPSIQGLYLLFDAHKGTPRVLMDAKELTVRRTAATSALASGYLSRQASSTMLMVGTGALAPHLIKAHASVRPIEEVLIWGRDSIKSQQLVDSLSDEAFVSRSVHSIEEGMEQADIISCATLSETPLIYGKHLRAGQHIDLVGAYRPDMREADDELIKRSRVFIDTAMAMKETGDIAIPLSTGVLKPEEISANLFELCSQTKQGRASKEEITCFKSVGYALEDLVAATLVANNFTLD
ncbi:MAG: ornithine cyclodeaminase family protein [Cyclobacteriaceae bacterium]